MTPADAFILSPPSDSTPQVAKAELWVEVARKVAAPRFQTITGKTGRIVLKPLNKESSDALKAIAHGKSHNLTSDSPLSPRIVIDSVDREITKENLASRIADQNPDLTIDSGDRASFIRPIFKTGPLLGDSVSWVCEVKPKYYFSLLGEAIFLGFSRCRVRKFERITQCKKCLRFGHPETYCKESSPSCARCAKSGHSIADCPATNKIRCANCGAGHLATDALCTYRTSFLANRLARTDFGIPPSTSS